MATLSPKEPTTVEKMRGLRWSIAGDSANAVFVEFTFFGSVFILFLDALALSKGQIGIVLSLFPFAGLIAPFIAPRVARFGYKRTFITFWGIRKAFAALLLLTLLLFAALAVHITFLVVENLLTPGATRHHELALHAIRRGPYSKWFWGVSIGVGGVVPLALLAFGIAAPVASPLLLLASILSLAGTFAWEYVWVEAGQSVPIS